MTDKKPNTWRFYGIDEPGVHILKLIAYFMNGHGLEIRDEERQLGRYHDLPLEDMFRGSRWVYDDVHRYAHDRLLDSGLLREGYVCRRKIDWIPTQQGLQAMRDCLSDNFCEQIHPMNSDYKSDLHTWGGSKNGPFYTDPNEGLVHRKGVEVVGSTLPYIPWATRDHRGMPIGINWYPNGEGEQSNYDLYVKTKERLKDVGVEVVTDHNNTQQLVEKWQRYNRKDCCTLWVFDGRSSACSLFNKLDSRGLVHLDGGTFSSASNWSSKAMNKKIQRSAGHPSSNQGDDIVQTITGVLEGGGDPIHEAYNEYYSNN